MVVFRQSGCNREKLLFSDKVVVSWQEWLYSGKVVVFGKSGCIRAKWLYSAKVVVFGNVVVFGQSGSYRAKVVVFGQT